MHEYRWHMINFLSIYIHDIELAAPSDKIDLIFKTFNNYHNRLKLISERENNRPLSFLDLLLTISNNTIYIDWFHKKAFFWKISVFPFQAHPVCHKIGTIYNLIDRALLLFHLNNFNKKT